jgi:hypothetical protein
VSSLRRLGAAVRARTVLLACPLVLAAVGLLLAGGLPGSPGSPRAAAQTAPGEVTAQFDASVPVAGARMIGATPQEPGAPGADETWAIGRPYGDESGGEALVRYSSPGGWSLAPALLDAAGQPLGRFKLDASPLAGQMTSDGAGVLLGTVPAVGGSGERQVVLARAPGGAFQETSPVPSEGEGSLGEALSLFGSRAPLLAPLDEPGGGVGALIVPVSQGRAVETEVLHWSGGDNRWRSEPIEIPAGSAEDFHVLGIGASSPDNAWLLAQLSSSSTYPPGAVALFRRLPSGEGGYEWKPAALGGAEDGEAHPLIVPTGAGPEPFTVPGAGEPPTAQAQLLTATGQGVWIDGERSDDSAAATIFLRPGGEGTAEGELTGSWCTPVAGAPACEHELPEALPRGPSRSIAWSGGSPFGERVITGIPEGLTLRLEGEAFRRVVTLGAGRGAQEDPGASFGAAFSDPTEGWLGTNRLPVHVTTATAPPRVAPWPVPFRHSLTAVAPAPGAPVGALSSEALAVGDLGEVARYRPGVGWLPESLFGPGERVETPRLRAVAWPTPRRAFAVGDYGQMWLWRGETGLWERDPATPIDFRGNLLGIAFDPGNPARGYAVGSAAVGSGGVLLRYGKTWTQEEAIPAQAQGASFTSIAFSGSEAIVAYRMLLNPSRNEYAGGLLINYGSGWQVDGGAAAVAGGAGPEAVAGLPDGGAAFAVSGPEGTRVFERESAGAPWQPTAMPLPRRGAGSLALFREGGALRAIASSGGAGSNYGNESEPAPPPSRPPNLIGPFPFGANGKESSLLRQTAGGWSDETRELDPIGEPEGLYLNWDVPYRQEALLAVLVDPTGTQGWAVGGTVNNDESRLETASIERYPADGSTPPGAGDSPVALNPGEATFAIGGGAQCAAPCASRAGARIGPDAWLSAALQRSGQIGVRAFLYTGPRLTNGETNTREPPVIPYAREEERYAQLLSSSPVPAYAAVTPQDLDARPLGSGRGTEAAFAGAFAGFLWPWGTGEQHQSCAETVGCEASYYALESGGTGGAVRVIVLDDSAGGDVGPTELAWLAAELRNAKEGGEPAIVLGNADLNAQMAGGDARAEELARVLVGGGGSVCRGGCASASAYFYYAPEENVTKPLQPPGTAESIPTFGTGTLGYVRALRERFGDFHGASGILLAEVDAAARNPRTNRAPVEGRRLIPVIGELALEAKDGILLRRSEPALFDALARRPRAGTLSAGGVEEGEVDPYIPIPENCVGATCETNDLFPEYTFTSSRPDIGDFVEPNLASPDPHAVLQNPKGEPIHDSKSGLFCAYNAGTTTVTISAGGLSSSLPVTVQAGSVRQPCGTQPLKEVAGVQEQSTAPPPPPPPTPAPTSAPPSSAPTPVPLLPSPPAMRIVVHPPQARPPATPFFLPAALAAPLLAFVPPPVPTPARPTPPTGTSAVTSPVEVAEREEEEEEATESAGNKAVAYRATDYEPAPEYVLGIVVLMALAGASMRRRPRRGRRTIDVAPATLTTMQAQRRMSRRASRWR